MRDTEEERAKTLSIPLSSSLPFLPLRTFKALVNLLAVIQGGGQPMNT
jgi:hypothetical protein